MRYPRKRLRSSTAIRTRGGIPELPSPVRRCDDPIERCNRVDRHRPTTQFAHDSTGRDPRDDCSVLQPLRRWDVGTGRDRWCREGQCLDGSSLECVRISACSSREPHGICILRIGAVVVHECDPFIETGRAASRAGTVIRLPMILRIRDQCSSSPAKIFEFPHVALPCHEGATVRTGRLRDGHHRLFPPVPRSDGVARADSLRSPSTRPVKYGQLRGEDDPGEQTWEGTLHAGGGGLGRRLGTFRCLLWTGGTVAHRQEEAKLTIGVGEETNGDVG